MQLLKPEWKILVSETSSPGSSVQGRVSQTSSNYRELTAAREALVALAQKIRCISKDQVKILMHNKTAVTYVAKQGGTQSLVLLRKTEVILLWAERYLKDITAVYLPDKQKFLADNFCTNINSL